MIKPKLHWIFFTGGPCGGKSTLINKAKQYLEQRGWKVFIIHEAATFLFSSGLSIGKDHLSGKEFQAFLIRYQMMVQNLIAEAAKLSKHQKVVILCDRSIIDSEAYVGEKMFKQLMLEFGLSKFGLLHDLDAHVIHCVTAAIGAPEAYSFESNATRTESRPLARKKDGLLKKAYTGAPHIYYLPNEKDGDFETKIREGIRIIMHCLGEPVPVEFEKKYLVTLESLTRVLNRYDTYKCIIKQDYLVSKSDISERIRQRGTGREWVFYHTIKKKLRSGGRYENDKMIDRMLFNELMFRKDDKFNQIVKDRYCFEANYLYFEFDKFRSKINGFDAKKYAILEAEGTSKNHNVKVPRIIKVIKDVTDDESFGNVELARKRA